MAGTAARDWGVARTIATAMPCTAHLSRSFYGFFHYVTTRCRSICRPHVKRSGGTHARGLLLIALLTLCAPSLCADGIEVQGLRFRFLPDGTLCLTHQSTTLHGTLVLPARVRHKGQVHPVTRIERMAFSWNNGLTRIVVPEGIHTIDEKAFQDCRTLQTLELPASLQCAGKSLVAHAAQLTCVRIAAATPPALAVEVFSDIPPQCTLQVPAGSAARYRAHEAFRAFHTITEYAE